MHPPMAKRVPHPHVLHGDTRPDDYYWLRDRQDPDVLAYLEAENRYLDEVMKPLDPLAERLYRDMLARIQEDRTEVPVQDGEYYYYSRTVAGQQYRIHARRRCASRDEIEHAQEEVLLDLNQLALGSDFLRVTVLRLSPDQTRLAYLENRDGTDRYTARVKDLTTGEDLPDQVGDVFIEGSLEWDALGQHLFYTTVDESQRPCRLWRHRIGDSGPDALLYEEEDVAFSLSLGKSRSGRHLFLHADSKVTSEVRYLAAADPLGEWRVFEPRRPGIEYDLEDWGEDFLILTNEDAENFRLLACPMSTPTRACWRELIPYDPQVYLQQMHPFADCLMLYGRQEGLSQIWVLRGGDLRRLEWAEPMHTVRIGPNRMYRAEEALVQYESLVTPRTTWALYLPTLELRAIDRDVVPGAYDAEDYVQERVWATADDGTSVPMSVVYRRGALDAGPAPLVLYGYGSYGISIDPSFDATRLPLLDRGIVFAIAHVRGGAELGRGWYENGKFLRKRNTFSDFVACAEELIRRRMTTPDRLAARGRSAGGLLMGAVANLRPDLFQVVSAGVPFVDVVTTMLDASIPLTTLEWEEWGDPTDPEYYAYMKSYSPYDNVAATEYPHLIVLTGLNDPRVGYWEPAKWVARLRATKTDRNTLVLRTHMGAGHGGSSGRYAKLRETALEYAFIVHHIGIGD